MYVCVINISCLSSKFMSSPVHSIISHLQPSPSAPLFGGDAKISTVQAVAPQMPVRARAESAEFFTSQRKNLVERNRSSQLHKNLRAILPQPSAFARFSS